MDYYTTLRSDLQGSFLWFEKFSIDKTEKNDIIKYAVSIWKRNRQKARKRRNYGIYIVCSIVDGNGFGFV